MKQPARDHYDRDGCLNLLTKDSLGGHEHIRDKVLRTSPEQRVTVVYTIGYEGASLGTFLDGLLAEGIRLLADVRAVPLSRKPGFSKNALREALEIAGIAYRHFPDLGDPKEGRDAARAGRYDQFRDIFGAHLATASAKASLKALGDLATVEPTCLMCFERDPVVCHRSIIGARLVDRGMVVVNLYDNSREAFRRQIRASHYPHQSGTPAE